LGRLLLPSTFEPTPFWYFVGSVGVSGTVVVDAWMVVEVVVVVADAALTLEVVVVVGIVVDVLTGANNVLTVGTVEVVTAGAIEEDGGCVVFGEVVVVVGATGAYRMITTPSPPRPPWACAVL
jgi:hypothetical protein